MSTGKKEKKYLYIRDNGMCRYCGKKLKYHQGTIDHYVPRSKGGPDDYYNLLLSCKYCNRVKMSRIPDNYQSILIIQFIKAIKDGMIVSGVQNRKNEEIEKIAKKMNRLEKLGDSTVFQSDCHRIVVKNNVILKMSKLSGTEESKHQTEEEQHV